MPKTYDEQALEKLDQILRILVATNATRGLKQREQIDLFRLLLGFLQDLCDFGDPLNVAADDFADFLLLNPGFC